MGTKGMKLFSTPITLMLGVALLIVGASMVFGPVFARQGGDAIQRPRVVGDTTALLTTGMGSVSGYTDSAIASGQERVKADPKDYEGFAQLGVAYLQKARESNDPTFYGQAEDALKKALAIKADYYDALSALGVLDLARHDFRQALDWGMRAQAVAPNSAYAYGVVGDAHVELGNYDEAVDAFQKMVDLRPNLGSYSRVSYARELHGDIPGAIEAMEQAIQAGSPAAENTAWCRVQLGNLYLNSNQPDKAEKSYEAALHSYPNYLHAQAGLAQLRWAQGRTDEAASLLKQSVEGVPLPQYLTALGDLYAAKGDGAAAKEQYDLVLYIYQVFEAGGVNVDLEKAAFLADHDLQVTEAVAMAERAAATRQDVNTQDTLAWALYKAGRYEEALAAQGKAMRLGTQNPLFYYHLGMIQSKLGKADEARKSVEKALQINPHFSIRHTAEAKKFLGE